jgi:hypothetical protein
MRSHIENPAAENDTSEHDDAGALIGSESGNVAPFVQIGAAFQRRLALLEQSFRPVRKRVGGSRD